MKRNYFLLLAFCLLAFANYSCGKEEEDQCSSDEVCEADFVFCIVDSKGYYQHGEEKFYCETPFVSVDKSCTQALADLNSTMCPEENEAETKAEILAKSKLMMADILASVDY